VGTGVLSHSHLAFDPALLRSIADRVGTPVYVYSANLIRAQYHALSDALKDVPHRICYSVKANGNLAVLKVLKALGAGADIVSIGELRRALLTGFAPSGIVFSGVGKTRAELEEAVRAGVGTINIESANELEVLLEAAQAATSGRGRHGVRAGIRVNPDVAAETHPYTKTGERTAKFGVPYDEVVTLARRIAQERSLVLVSLAMHIGSQITDVTPFHRGAVKLTELVTAIRASGIETIESLDVGGGIGVRYFAEKVPGLDAFAAAVGPPVRQAGLTLVVEPGRFLVAHAGVLLTRVLYRKHAGGKDYVIVDAGMTDFVRPSHYNAHHEIVPLTDGSRPAATVNVVGPVCESGDFLALDRKLPEVLPGELLAVLGTGAYGFVMSSTYNARPRPAEVMVEGDRYFVARQRESLDDLLRGETTDPVTWYHA
jgi:diaminopimelate decarboxylase